jgi:ribosomal protein L35
VTGKGKLRRLRTGRSHLRRKKSKRVRRSFDKYEKVDPVDRKRVRRLLGLKRRKK